jgi:ShK domain-like
VIGGSVKLKVMNAHRCHKISISVTQIVLAVAIIGWYTIEIADITVDAGGTPPTAQQKSNPRSLFIQDAQQYVTTAAATNKLGECLPSSTDESNFYCFARLRTITTAAGVDTASTGGGRRSGTDREIKKYTEDCYDVEMDECPGWAAQGECTINPDYMLHNCRFSCQTCVEIDGHGGITQIAPGSQDIRDKIVQHLTDTAQYVRTILQQEPQVRATCRNAVPECTYWAVQGQCTIGTDRAQYLSENCPAACHTCV